MRMVASFKAKADAIAAYREALKGKIGGRVVKRVLEEPKPVYGRWEFEVEL